MCHIQYILGRYQRCSSKSPLFLVFNNILVQQVKNVKIEVKETVPGSWDHVRAVCEEGKKADPGQKDA